MVTLENTVVINRPPEVVFDLLSDHRNEMKWNPKAQHVDKVTDGPVGLGTAYRAKWKSSPELTMECTRYERPRGWTTENGGPIAVRLDVTLDDLGGSTRVTTRFTPRPQGVIATLFFPLLLVVLRRGERSNSRLIKSWVEATSPSS